MIAAVAIQKDGTSIEGIEDRVAKRLLSAVCRDSIPYIETDNCCWSRPGLSQRADAIARG